MVMLASGLIGVEIALQALEAFPLQRNRAGGKILPARFCWRLRVIALMFYCAVCGFAVCERLPKEQSRVAIREREPV